MTTIQPAYGWAELDAANAQHYARKLKPLAIRNAEEHQARAWEDLYCACDLHEQAGTDESRQNMLDAVAFYNAATDRLEELRAEYRDHPEERDHADREQRGDFMGF